MKDQLNIKGIGFRWSHDTMTSEEASHWLDTVLSSVKGSVFLPEDGCGQWSVFYLQRLGMSKLQVLDYLRTFEACIRLKRGDPTQQEVPDHLVKRLFETGTFPGHGVINAQELMSHVA